MGGPPVIRRDLPSIFECFKTGLSFGCCLSLMVKGQRGIGCPFEATTCDTCTDI